MGGNRWSPTETASWRCSTNTPAFSCSRIGCDSCSWRIPRTSLIAGWRTGSSKRERSWTTSLTWFRTFIEGRCIMSFAEGYLMGLQLKERRAQEAVRQREWQQQLAAQQEEFKTRQQ